MLYRWVNEPVPASQLVTWHLNLHCWKQSPTEPQHLLLLLASVPNCKMLSLA